MGNYQIHKIDDHTWQLRDPFRTYLYVLEGTEKAVLLDAGNGFSGLRETVKSLTDKPVSVVMTHGHFDHTGCAAEFGTCYLHKNDEEVLKTGFDKNDRLTKMEHFSRIYDTPLTEKELEYLINAKTPEKLAYIQNGDILDLGSRSLEVIETPAHTCGSICLLDKKMGIFFPGIPYVIGRFWCILIIQPSWRM